MHVWVKCPDWLKKSFEPDQALSGQKELIASQSKAFHPAHCGATINFSTLTLQAITHGRHIQPPQGESSQ